jgi:hypothetical protein
MAGPEGQRTFRPFTFRGCDLRAECLPATEEVRVQLPAAAPAFARYVWRAKAARRSFSGGGPYGSSCMATAGRPILHRLSVSTRPSLQNSAHSGQHGGSLPISGVVADKQCTCPASKPMWERCPPTPPFHCGENEIQASPISSASVGATPTPATNFREVIRQSGRNPDVSKHVGSDDWSVTSTSHHFWTRSSISRAPRCLREG